MQKFTPFQRFIPSAFSLTLLATVLISGCQDAPQVADKPKLRLVRTLVVETTSAQNWREFPGVVEAAQQADLGFRVPGKLSGMQVEEGDNVNADQVLARLESTDYQIQLNSQKAEFDQANADFERAKSLLQQGLIAKADYDKLEAQRAATLAAMEAAQQNLLYTFLKAPFAGVIARRHVDNYEDVSTMQPILTLQDLSSLHVKVDIPETVMIRLKQDSNAKVFAMFDALPSQQFPLALQAVSTEADPGSRTFAVTFNMPNLDSVTILPGMSVTVRGAQQDQSQSSAILVPAQTVVENAQGRFVYVVENSGDGTGTVRETPVTIGEVYEVGIVVLSGLKEGDHLITAGMSKMSEGLHVRVEGGENK